MKATCPYCAEPIEAGVQVCPWCRTPLGAPPPGPPVPPPLIARGPLGEDRSIALWIVLGFLTCGICFYVWLYQIAADLNRHGGRDRLNPILDIFLVLLTCGLWFIYIMYTYSRAWLEIQTEEGVPRPDDNVTVCTILGIFCPLAGMAILQHSMNQHWRAHALPHA